MIFEGELVVWMDSPLMNVSDDSLIGVSGNEHEGLKPFAGEPNSTTKISEFFIGL